MERLSLVDGQLKSNLAGAKTTLSVIDNRTGKSYEIPIKDNYIQAAELEKILDANGKVLRSYDPGYMNTICCTSRISFIDGDKGILEYRGYPIEQLAEKSNFLEVAFLLIYGELPTKADYNVWHKKIMTHTFLHTDAANMMHSFRYDSHPMGMFISTMGAISTFHPEQNPALAGQEVYKDKKLRNKQIYRLLGTTPTVAASAYRHRIGRQYNKPQPDLGYVENFLYMMDRLNEPKYRPHPKLVRALDILFILHAEHELNCSTAAVRHLASSGVDIYTAIAGASAALYGPRHGGANEAVLKMLEQIGEKKIFHSLLKMLRIKRRC